MAILGCLLNGSQLIYNEGERGERREKREPRAESGGRGKRAEGRWQRAAENGGERGDRRGERGEGETERGATERLSQGCPASSGLWRHLSDVFGGFAPETRNNSIHGEAVLCIILILIYFSSRYIY